MKRNWRELLFVVLWHALGAFCLWVLYMDLFVWRP